MTTKVLGVDVGRVGGKVGEKVGDLSGGLGSSIGGGLSDLGSHLKEQRQNAQLSLRQLAAAAGVSNPYLSQVERGLRRPSAEVLQQIARGLRISAEALYVRAGILEDRGEHGEVEAAVRSDPYLSERQRDVLLEIYATFRAENHRQEVPEPVPATPETAPETEAAPTPGSTTGPPPGPPARTRGRRPRPQGEAAATSSSGDPSTGDSAPTAQTPSAAGPSAATASEQAAPRKRTPRTTTAQKRASGTRSSAGTPGGRAGTRPTPTPRAVAEEASIVVPEAPDPEELAATHEPSSDGDAGAPDATSPRTPSPADPAATS